MLTEKEDVELFDPAHFKPNVKFPLESAPGILERVELIELQGSPPFVHLMLCTDVSLTDSDELQDKTLSLGKRVLVMRETSEQPKAADNRTVKLTGINTDLILSKVVTLLDNGTVYGSMTRAHNRYVAGICSQQIRDANA